MAKIVSLRSLLLLLICACIYFVFSVFNGFQIPSNVLSSSKTLAKIDWTNYTVLEMEKLREGPGEKGWGVMKINENEKDLAEKLVKEYSINVIVSDHISLDRSLPDFRPKDCLELKYSSSLPAVSIVILFHDEYLSCILRTLHSIINRTPSSLLKEIILVDDCSTKGSSKNDLDWHLLTTYPDKNIRVLRLQERHGLIRARMQGILNSTSDIVVVMDAHMEVNTNWLPPLIEPIFEDFQTVTEPLVEYIDSDNLGYVNGGNGYRGGFRWNLRYLFMGREMSNVKESDNFFNPVILGAIAAFNKSYFWHLGGYDPGLQVWGGEQFDLSFKVWMCGGRILKIPCSRVGHNYKEAGYHPFISNHTYIDPNLKRIAEVWLDEYKAFFYRDTGLNETNAGYLEPQIELRQRLGCKSFKWFLETVAPDVLDLFPVNMSAYLAYGAIQSISQPKYCVDNLEAPKGDPLGLYACHKDENLTDARNQFFMLTKHNDIRFKEELTCWDVWHGNIKNDTVKVTTGSCHFEKGNQYFEYDQKTQQIKTGKNYCLEGNFENSTQVLFMKKCNETLVDQKWKWHTRDSANVVHLY